MDREGFLDTIRQQYAEDIYEAYLHCERGGGKVIDYSKLSVMLKRLLHSACVDGLNQEEFEELVRATLPLADMKVDWLHFEEKAAA